MTSDEKIVLRALELGLSLAEHALMLAKTAEGTTATDDWEAYWATQVKLAEADVRDIKYAIRLAEAWT